MITLYEDDSPEFNQYCLGLELMGIPYRIVPVPVVTDEQVEWMDSAARAPIDIGHISESNL